MNLMLINVSTRKFRRAVRLPEGDVPAPTGGRRVEVRGANTGRQCQEQNCRNVTSGVRLQITLPGAALIGLTRRGNAVSGLCRHLPSAIELTC
jgi:hypothetical protein